MGLVVTVGRLSDPHSARPTGAGDLRAQFAAVARAMAAAGLPPHVEPEGGAVWSAQGYGYTGLHALREVAGLVWQGLPIPTDRLLTGEDTPAAEALFALAAASCAPPLRTSFLSRLLGERERTPPPPPPFLHLTLHSDADGFYVPADFPRPVIPMPPPPGTETLWPLGSVPRLLAELGHLADALGVTEAMPAPDDLLEDWLEAPKAPATALWQAQPIATHSLLILRDACRRSLETGAAIAFT